jgi:hypothetical protein
MTDHIGRTGGSAEAAADTGIFFYVGDGHARRGMRPEDGYLPLPDFHLDGAVRAGIFTGATAAAPLFIYFR